MWWLDEKINLLPRSWNHSLGSSLPRKMANGVQLPTRDRTWMWSPSRVSFPWLEGSSYLGLASYPLLIWMFTLHLTWKPGGASTQAPGRASSAEALGANTLSLAVYQLPPPSWLGLGFRIRLKEKASNLSKRSSAHGGTQFLQFSFSDWQRIPTVAKNTVPSICYEYFPLQSSKNRVSVMLGTPRLWK